MKVAAFVVAGLLSALSAAGVGKELRQMPGVHADVNYVSQSTTVHYDESRPLPALT